jgi:hypothetical protein
MQWPLTSQTHSSVSQREQLRSKLHAQENFTFTYFILLYSHLSAISGRTAGLFVMMIYCWKRLPRGDCGFFPPFLRLVNESSQESDKPVNPKQTENSFYSKSKNFCNHEPILRTTSKFTTMYVKRQRCT